MSKLRIASITILFTFLIVNTVWAHHPTGGAGLGKAGPIRTLPATTLPKGKAALALQTEYIKLDSFSDSELIGFAENGNDVHSVDYIFHTILSIGYGISDDLTLGLKFSYEYLDNIREAHHEEPEEVHNRGNAQGFGDTTIFGQYRFLKMDHELESALLFGLKMPTGKTTVNDKDGERFETEFQPGTGSWNPILGLAFTKRLGKLSLDANLLYTFSSEGAQDTNLGDFLNYNAAVSYNISNKDTFWDLIFEVNGEWKEREMVSGVEDENSGGNTIFLSPGIRFTWDKIWSAYLSVGFPVVQNLNGVQNDTDIRSILGISLSF